MAHVKYFANNKDRMSLTDKVLNQMLLTCRYRRKSEEE